MEKTLKARFWLMLSMVVGIAIMRVIPHPPNFTPVAAMALFGGACFDRKKWAFIIPLLAMLLSDTALQLLFGWGFHNLMPVVYLSFIAIVGLGLWVRKNRKVSVIISASIASSVLFFITTNFAVWGFSSLYPKTIQGLIACYTMALPFFGNTLGGDLFYTAVLFGVFALAEQRIPLFARPQTAS